MSTELHHVSLVVRNLDQSVAKLERILGARVVSKDTSDKEMRTAVHLSVGGSEVVLMEPLGESPVLTKFLEAKGEGVHSIGFEVDDLQQVLRDLEANDVRPVHKGNAMGFNYIFLHPKDTCGMMVELFEKQK